jgi:shikimate kinase
LRTHGIVIWLEADPGELARRLLRDVEAGAERPSLTPAGTLAEIAAVLSARIPLYGEVADLSIDTRDRTPEAVAELILVHWNAPCLPVD